MNKLLEDTALYALFQADGVAELKSKLIDVIVDEVRDQLRDSSNYIISPEDIATGLYEDILEEVKTEVRELYKKKIMNKFDAMFE